MDFSVKKARGSRKKQKTKYFLFTNSAAPALVSGHPVGVHFRNFYFLAQCSWVFLYDKGNNRGYVLFVIAAGPGPFP